MGSGGIGSPTARVVIIINVTLASGGSMGSGGIGAAFPSSLPEILIAS